MSSHPYTAPSFKASAFNCPRCSAYAAQSWFNALEPGMAIGSAVSGFAFSRCAHCTECSVWLSREKKLVYPVLTVAPPPNPDLPEDIAEDYLEASRVLNESPRSAAALLRLCVQKICKHLGEPGHNINTDIGALVKKGLPVEIQQALDIVRIVGNSSVHPGQLDVRDDADLAYRIFGLVNAIAENRISQPKRLAELFGKMPDSARQQVARRDGNGSK